jgi:hypothetical protein
MEEETQEVHEEQEIIEEAPKETTSIRSEPAISRKGRREKVKINKKVFVFVFIIILIVSAAIFLLKEPNIEVEPLPESEPVEEEVQEPTTTPSQESLKRESIRIEILNGTGIAKQAANFEEELNNLGYEDIEVGNVSKDETYENTEVTYSPSVDERVKDEINQILNDLYEDVTEDGSDLGDFDIRVIVGLRKGQALPTDIPSPTPTVKVSPTPTATISATPAP